ncbi:TPA: restriction endonuclease subunit S [Photobacterium damselae]
MTVESLITQHIDTWTSAVKTKSTSGRGSSKKLELYGVKKLRELILELAVRGKLVPQDPNDEPASVLLERIAAEKAQLVKEGKIKKENSSKALAENSLPFSIPNNWCWERLPNITFFQEGPGILAKDFRDTGVPLIRIAGMHQEMLSLEGCNYLDEEMVSDKWDHFRLNHGDIVISSSASLGKVAKVGKDTVGSIVYTGLIRFRPYSNVSYDYIAKFFASPEFNRQIGNNSRGAAIKHFGPTHLKTMIFPLPPVEEQHRIVAKVDELMTLCDQLEQQTEASIEAHQLLVSTLLNTLTHSADADELMENWARISDHFDTLFTTEESIDQLKQTILQLAVMGKLVPQDPNDEPASVLLERIAEEKAQLIKEKKIKKQKALPPITDDEKPFDLPNGWEWCRLPDLGELARGKSKHRPRNDPKLYENGNIPLVQTGDVARANGTILTYTAKYNEFGLAQSQLWPKGTLCITIAANIADTATLGFDACFPDSVVGYTPYDKEIPTVYFDFFIKTAKENLERFAPSTAQKNINLEILSNVLVPCPPKQQFSRIVGKVNALLGVCEDLKVRLKESQTTQLHLTDAIVEQAV